VTLKATSVAHEYRTYQSSQNKSLHHLNCSWLPATGEARCTTMLREKPKCICRITGNDVPITYVALIQRITQRSSNCSTTTSDSSHSVRNVSCFDQWSWSKAKKGNQEWPLEWRGCLIVSHFPFNGVIICMTQTTEWLCDGLVELSLN
jgi:hypothetical protein